MITTKEDENIILRKLSEALLRNDIEYTKRILRIFNTESNIDLEDRGKIVRKILLNLYKIARKIGSEKQYQILAALAITYNQVNTIENELDHIAYIATLEEIESSGMSELIIRFKDMPILAVDLADKLSLQHDIYIDDDIVVRVELGTEIYLNYIVRRILYPLALVTELTDILVRKSRRMTMRRLFEIYTNILELCKDKICKNIRKLIDNEIISNLKLSDEVTVIDYSRNRAVGRLFKDDILKEGILVEQIDKLVKVGDLLILWHI